MRLLLIPILGITALGQTHLLNFNPLEAEYSVALDKIIMVTASPGRLMIYDPVARTTVTVPLTRPAAGLSVSPNGLYAAVGHLNLISYVNLTTATVERTYDVLDDGAEIALGPQYVYTTVTATNLSTGVVTNTSNIARVGRGLRYHPSGRALYGGNSGNLARMDISTGPVTSITNSPYFSGFGICGPVWFSPDGRRIYNLCGSVLQSSADPALELTYLTSFGGYYVGAFAETASGRLAIVPWVFSPSQLERENEVLVFDSAYLRQTGRYVLPDFTSNGSSFQAHGRWIFFNNAGSSLYAVMQADSLSGLSNDFAVQTIPLSNPPACGVTFGSSSASLAAHGGPGTLGLTAQTSCNYTAVSNAPWIVLTGSTSGSGNGTISYHVRPNTGAARSGTITIGQTAFTINQDAPPAVAPAARRLGYKVVDARYDRGRDKLILVSAKPDELHIQDPLTGSEQIVPLSAPPIQLTLRPDGLSAAVTHDGWISIVNLQTAAVERVVESIDGAVNAVYAGNGRIYAFSTVGRSMKAITVASGVSSTVRSDNRFGVLHPSGSFIYGEQKFDIRGPVPLPMYPAAHPCFYWFNEPGTLIMTTCSKIFRSSENQALDWQPAGSFPGVLWGLRWADHSQSAGATVTALGNEGNPDPADMEIRVFRDPDFSQRNRYFLPRIQEGATSHPVRGRWAFWNGAGNRIVAIEEADPTLQLPAPFAVTSFSTADCTVNIATGSASASSDGATGSVAVTAAPGCPWHATANVPWIGATAGSSGTGSGTVTYSIAPNGDPGARSGILLIGDKSFTVNQSGVVSVATISPASASFPAQGCSGSFRLTVSPAYTNWTAAYSSTWLEFPNGLPFFSGTGSADIAYRCQPNAGPPRIGSIGVLGQQFTVTQFSNTVDIVSPTEGQVINGAGVTFLWSPVGGVAGYSLEIRSGQSLVFTGSLLGANSTTTVITLPTGSFTFLVRPCTAVPLSGQNCGAPVTRNFQVALPVPTAIPIVTSPSPGQNLTTSTHELKWSPVLGTTRFEVLLRDMAAGGAPELSISVPGFSTIYSMRSSTQYRLQVRGCSDACGAWSAAIDFSVTLPPVPTAAPNAPSCGVNSNRVTCNWNSVTNADLYLVQIVQPGAGPGGGALTVASRQVSTASISEPDPLIAPTGASFVFVAACNGNGCGPNSSPVGITVSGSNAPDPNLGVPAAGTVVTRNDVLFSWNRVPGDPGNTVYRLYVQDLARAAPALDVLTRNNYYAARFRGEGGRYDALVIANPGPSQVQGPASGFVVRASSPLAPTMVQPRHQESNVTSVLTGANLQLGWTPVPGATAYEYYVGVAGAPALRAQNEKFPNKPEKHPGLA